MWGVWLPNEGWLKASRPNGIVDACAFANHGEARSLARLLGGRSMPIDDSIASPAVEAKLKEAEIRNRERQGKLCRIFKTLFANRKK
jgi:hypothetical protein